MPFKSRKNLKKIILTAIILIAGGFVLNWYLVHRLENYLREELSKRVSEATNDFYQLDYSNLRIGLWNGELEIDSVIFKPNPTLFNEYMERDSLPETYLDFTIDKIHFKGINLVWRVSYKELNFSLFEIKKPEVHIYSSNYSDKLPPETTVSDSTKTLHDLISPYIDVLTVEEMNLTNASIKYTTGKEDNSSLYQLLDVSFHAYGFRLDEDSYTSGKLLYCDDFDFTTNQPQSLLANEQFLFNTEKIYLSTKDSLINIEKINLIPQRNLWTQRNQTFDSYIETNVEAFKVEGIRFKRENAKNFLEARNFSISESDIQYFATKKDSISDNKQSSTEQTVIAWSLYSIISPVLQSVTIDSIGIQKAKLAYTLASDGDTDLYSLNEFNFSAYDFRVDSLADKEKQFLYSENFSIDATGINGTVRSKNHVITVEEMLLDTRKGNFDIRAIRLWPIDTNTNLDYMQGTIDSLKIADIVNEGGLRAKELTIDAPSVEYVRMPQKGIPQTNNSQPSFQPEAGSQGVIGMVMLLVNHLAVDKIYLNKGNLTYRDKQGREEMVYKIPKVDFFADNVLLNQQTVENAPAFVTYDNYGFKFQNFDNLLPGKNYRVKVKSGIYTGLNGNLTLRDIALIPQKSSWKKAPDRYMSFTSPSIEVKGIDYVLGTSPDKFGFASIDIRSPHVRLIKVRESSGSKTNVNNKLSNPKIVLGSFHMTNADFGYMDISSKDSTAFTIKDISLKSLTLTSQQEFTVESVLLRQPAFYTIKHEQNEIHQNGSNSSTDNFFKKINIGSWKVDNLKMEVDEPLLKMKSEIPSIDIHNVLLNNSKFSMKSMIVSKPQINVIKLIDSEKIEITEMESNSDIYDKLKKIASHFTIDRFDINDARIDYINTLNGKSIRQQQVNSTHLDFVGLNIDTEKKQFSMDDFNFSTKNMHFPLDNGFYTLQIGDVDLHKENKMLILNNLHLVPAYPKEEFAYHHPKHKDWFDVSVGSIKLSEIDYPTYFSNQILNIKDAHVNDVKLLNYKNQQIEIEHNIMPMIYEGLQKAPLKLNIDKLDIHNFMVVYEELPKKGDVAGKIFFTEMNGKFTGFTNIVKEQNQYIRLDADGKFMGKGDFNATWMIPVDTLTDRFLFVAHLRDFDLKEMNQLIDPLASARVNRGYVDSLILKTEASSKAATVQMRFIYKDLDFTLFKKKEGEAAPNRFITGVANAFIKSNNPDKPGKGWREPYLSLERDPYHSTFNYLWQILQPPLVESVGVSQKTQNFFKGVSGFISKVKNFFSGGDKKKKDELENKE